MVITGYSTINGENFVLVSNPAPVRVGSEYSITYERYVAGPTHTHWDDFYNIRYTGR
jgi:hypothetical protein